MVRLAGYRTGIHVNQGTGTRTRLNTTLNGLTTCNPVLDISAIFGAVIISLSGLILNLDYRRRLISVRQRTQAPHIARRRRLKILRNVSVRLNHLNRHHTLDGLQVVRTHGRVVRVAHGRVRRQVLATMQVTNGVRHSENILTGRTSIRQGSVNLNAARRRRTTPGTQPSVLISGRLMATRIVKTDHGRETRVINESRRLRAALYHPMRVLLGNQVYVHERRHVNVGIAEGRMKRRISLSNATITCVRYARDLQ